MRIDHREKKDDMEKDNIIADLKKNFKNIYESPEKRVDCSEWEKMVKKPYNDFPEETAEAAAEFVMTHRYMPSAAVRSLLQAVKLRDHPSFFSALYSEKITQDLIGTNGKERSRQICSDFRTLCRKKRYRIFSMRRRPPDSVWIKGRFIWLR